MPRHIRYSDGRYFRAFCNGTNKSVNAEKPGEARMRACKNCKRILKANILQPQNHTKND